MKRLLFVVLAACTLMLLIMVGVAVADGGPHGGYTPTTDGCAGCHRAHTAQAPLLLTTSAEELCLSCHGSTATGADTNVADGVYTERDGFAEDPAEGVDGRGLRGGGFINTLMDTGLSGAAATMPATSAHTFDGTAGTAWGNGEIGSGAGAEVTLECTNCHDPHGNGNYRILRPIPTESGAATAVNVPDEAEKVYTIASDAGKYFGEGQTLGYTSGQSGHYYPPESSRGVMSEAYQSISDWCGACHTRYMGGRNSAQTDSGDEIFAYRHASLGSYGPCSNCHNDTIICPDPADHYCAENAIITYNPDNFKHAVECMTCHVAHGTSADMTTDGPYSGSVAWPDGSTAPDGDARSTLLRIDGRGVCQACHNKSPAP